jgi:hypothetical protein
MAMTTLLDLANQQYAAAQSAATTAQAVAGQAQHALVTALAAQAAAAATVADLQRQMTDVRNQLAAAPTAGDGSELIADLERITIASRAAQASVLEADERLAAARWNANQSAAELARATAGMKDADAVQKQAQKDNDARTALKTALGVAPLSTLPADAKAALGAAPAGQSYLDAKARIEGDIPAGLLTAARARRDNFAGLLDAAATAATTAQTNYLTEAAKQGGAPGQVQELQALILVAETACKDFAANAGACTNQARATLARVANKSINPLTDAQRAVISATSAERTAALSDETNREVALLALLNAQKALVSATLAELAAPTDATAVKKLADAKAAATKAASDYTNLLKSWDQQEVARDASLEDLNKKLAALDVARAKAKAKLTDPSADPENDADVKAAEQSVKDARAAFDKAQADYAKSSKGVLQSWEAAVPDTSWQQLYDFDAAVSQLTAIGNADVAGLVTSLTQAETNLVNAMIAAAAAADLLHGLDVARAELVARVDCEKNARQRSVFSALRGDGDRRPHWGQ